MYAMPAPPQPPPPPDGEGDGDGEDGGEGGGPAPREVGNNDPSRPRSSLQGLVDQLGEYFADDDYVGGIEERVRQLEEKVERLEEYRRLGEDSLNATVQQLTRRLSRLEGRASEGSKRARGWLLG